MVTSFSSQSVMLVSGFEGRLEIYFRSSPSNNDGENGKRESLKTHESLFERLVHTFVETSVLVDADSVF